MNFRTAFMSALALIAFAGNSVLCRLALTDASIHPASFTGIRLVSGALTLVLLVWVSSLATKSSGGHSSDGGLPNGSISTFALNVGWTAPLMLFAYASLFSFAYISLDTGVGALILFGSVQITMLSINLVKGNRLSYLEWLGLLLACAGLVYLVLPELSKPSILGFAMMSVAGMAWGAYTVLGQGSQKPLNDTASNFIKSVPFALILLLPFIGELSLSPLQDADSLRACVLAVASGAITSGVGYAVWYSALRNLNTTQAGVMQLLVPVLASIGGVMFANELVTERLVISSLLTLGGMLIVISAKKNVA